MLTKGFKEREHRTLSIGGKVRPHPLRKGNMFTSLHIYWALFFMLHKRTFEPFPMNKWPITIAMQGKFKLLQQSCTVCLVPPAHSLHTYKHTHTPNPLAHQDGAVQFVCLYSSSHSLLFIFSVQHSSPFRDSEMAPLAFWSKAQTLSTKLWRAWQAKQREDERGDERERGCEAEKWEEKKGKGKRMLKCETERVYRERTCLCGVLMYCRCHRHWPASGQQPSLANT